MIDNEKNIAFWDAEAKKTDAGKKALAGMLGGRKFETIYRCNAKQDRFLTLFKPSSGMRVLEVGSGGGRWGLFLADKVGEYLGLDISSGMVEVAEQERKRRGLPNVRFECRNLLDFDTSEKFDLVYFSSVLQYMDDDVVAQCIARVPGLLAPSGKVISRDTVQSARRTEKTGNYPVIFRTENEYRKLFAQGGFDFIDSMPSYDLKRFTILASRLYQLPGVTYGMAYAFRKILCWVDGILGNPAFLKTKGLIRELEDVNLREHRFSHYVTLKLLA